jgi:hypothetical protein
MLLEDKYNTKEKLARGNIFSISCILLLKEDCF